MPQNLRSSKAKQRQGQLGQPPGAAHLQAAGQLPQRLAICQDGQRDVAAATGMPVWQMEAAHRQRQARGGKQGPQHARLQRRWQEDTGAGSPDHCSALLCLL